jgi:hypothetical protein
LFANVVDSDIKGEESSAICSLSALTTAKLFEVIVSDTTALVTLYVKLAHTIQIRYPGIGQRSCVLLFRTAALWLRSGYGRGGSKGGMDGQCGFSGLLGCIFPTKKKKLSCCVMESRFSSVNRQRGFTNININLWLNVNLNPTANLTNIRVTTELRTNRHQPWTLHAVLLTN